ncbi:MAG: PspC domain-containing protein [Bacteroidales bacterium]|jgi:phage shock protein PspC (stress-responsive transcriptional regulator)|nr:PspC domain-containing protein [Bacteroidales bacterium]
MKKLTRSSNKKIMGIAAGVAEYFDIDPTIVRVIWACAILCGGFGLLAYIICMFVVPEK